ncbi:MAG: 3-dehydroquinate synthase, partial [Candidatus Omnitrophica bacterium]|nr:3-dehydroquinate synthase [Candidatus Omnitrophota bacterium]
KKARGGRLRWVLPTRIGHVVVTPDVPEAVVRAVVQERVAA